MKRLIVVFVLLLAITGIFSSLSFTDKAFNYCNKAYAQARKEAWVWINVKSFTYHSYKCRYVKPGSKNIAKIRYKDVASRGATPCKVCGGHPFYLK